MKLREALQALYDEQNGAPLIRRYEQWAHAMELARAALAEPVADEPVAFADRVAFESAMAAGKGCDVWPKAGDYTQRTGRQLIALYTRPAPTERVEYPPLPPDLSVEQLAAWLHLNLYGYVDARPNGSGAQVESFTDEQIVKAIEDAGHNLAYRNYEQDIECGRAVIAAYRAQRVPLDALVQRFLQWPVPADVYPDGTPGQPGRTGTNLLSAEQARSMLEHVLGMKR